jgi:hypothetical protein
VQDIDRDGRKMLRTSVKTNLRRSSFPSGETSWVKFHSSAQLQRTPAFMQASTQPKSQRPSVAFQILLQRRTITHKKHDHYREDKKFYQTKKCPFKTLGLSSLKEIQYSVVKTTFLQIAMKHHPDTCQSKTPEDEVRNHDLFVAARQAFEQLVGDENGVAYIKGTEAELLTSQTEIDKWFQEETGYSMPYMDARTMREVAEMTKTMGVGVSRKVLFRIVSSVSRLESAIVHV